ncbi:hypothetical protein HBI81_122240 [Parastagonospora nodorum]|nr:hypothetical protein HBI80_134410 [Parastagonospora nodorum]KAH5045062.1 hypothetical protein HBI75_014840 [Parastagonospora nodorum]KAH5206121.1 hypothetical protein HBH68_090170 [Parastagonospora nodorum]KAH5269739.1 hypothetical protein HBI71_062030 [Parastagonospora nodorum]KAH5280358.1 hypothetical protein HBI72_019010 [Parastagonospora nodorum]
MSYHAAHDHYNSMQQMRQSCFNAITRVAAAGCFCGCLHVVNTEEGACPGFLFVLFLFQSYVPSVSLILPARAQTCLGAIKLQFSGKGKRMVGVSERDDCHGCAIPEDAIISYTCPIVMAMVSSHESSDTNGVANEKSQMISCEERWI